MAVPAFLLSSFSYREDVGIDDVADVITALRDELLNQQTPPWTEPVGGTFKSPPDGNGRFFEFDIVTISPTRLSMVVRDDTGTEILDGTADIDTNDVVRYFTGQYHCQIEFEGHTSAGIGEAMGCGITDMTPEASDITRANVWAHARRNAAGALDAATNVWHEFRMLNNGVVAGASRALASLLGAGTNTALFTHSGNIVTKPVELNSTPQGNPHALLQPIGRVYQHLVVSDEFSFGAELIVPIDDALVGAFKVSVRAVSNHLAAWRIA